MKNEWILLKRLAADVPSDSVQNNNISNASNHLFQGSKKSLLFMFLLFLSSIITAQNIGLDWAGAILSGAGSNYGKAIATDANGNVYTAGYFQGTSDFDPGPGTTNLSTAGLYDIYVTKFDAQGNLVWAKNMGGGSQDKAYGIAVDNNGNVYTTGTFQGSADFNPGAGTFTLNSSGGTDVFVSKLDNSGNFMWAGKFSGTSNNFGADIAVDDNENIYLTGYFNGTVDFDPAPVTNVFNLTTSGGREIFVVKLNIAYNLVWAKKMGGTQSEESNAITLDNNGNVYTTGTFEGTADFDPGAGSFTLTSSSSFDDIFISKLDNSGNFLWAKQLGGNSPGWSNDIVVDASGNVYTTGGFDDTFDFDPGAGSFSITSNSSTLDIFISKLDNSGNFVWAKSVGGSSPDEGASITTDSNGDVYLTGDFQSTNADFDPGAGTFTMSPIGNNSAFNLKLNALGDFQWANNIDGAGDNYGQAIAVTAADNVHITGYFSGNTDFDPGAGTFFINSVNGVDAYIQKLAPCISTSSTDVQTACDSYTWIDGNTYTSSNNSATQTLTNAAGCDSIVTLDLTILNSTSSTDAHTECDSYTWIDGNTYTSSNNTATQTLTNAAGCDSVVTLDLTILNSTSSTDAHTECDSYTWIDGNTYTSSNNTATHVLTNAAGCDSVVTLDLTINQSTSSTDVLTTCDNQYTWIDGNTYTSNNNTATHVLTNAAGCDSTVTLDLTFLNSTAGIDSRTECDSYTWIDGNTYTSSNNTATYTLTNTAGCDSVVTLDLTILSSTSGVDTRTECDSYVWIDGNTYTSSNNSATYTIVGAAANGCDSVVTLDLTILNSTSSTDAHTECDSYTWIDGNTYTSSNNTATHVLTNAAGCDSVVTLDLTINQSTTSTDVVTTCDASYTWIDGNTYTSSNNTATHIIVNAAGCDSTITLDLTFTDIDTSVNTSGATFTANMTGASYQWLDCDNGYAPISGETSQSFTATTNGNYAVEVSQNGCVDTSACMAYTNVGINSIEHFNEVSVYPNPANNVVSLETNNEAITQVRLLDITGKEIKTFNPGNKQLNVADLSRGIYFLEISNTEKRSIVKLALQ